MCACCDAGDATWKKSDAELCALGIRDLSEHLKFISPSEVANAYAERSRDAYPRYGLGYKEAVDAIKRELRQYRNLNIVGRGGTFRYNNSDHSMLSAMRAVDNVLSNAGHDIWAVNVESAYHEEQTDADSENPYRTLPEAPPVREAVAGEA